MAKSFKSKRAIFPKNKQKKFILNAKKRLNLTWNQIAKMLNISTRNLTDWKNEKIYISFDAVKIICKIIKISIPKNIEIRKPFWYANKGAKIGGIAVYQKYGIIGGNPEYRKKKWRKWWEQEGKFKKHIIVNKTLPIKKPRKSRALAEFVGIVLGDGGISKYQLTITLNFKDDKNYIKFVVKLIKKLFSVNPSIYREEKKSIDNIVVSRIKLVKFCVEKLGLKIGNKIKQQIDIPNWIKRNKKFQIACIRGLVDTDGSIFTHNYKVNGKIYSYKKIDFSSSSYPLLNSVYLILKKLGLKPRITRDNKKIRLENIKDVKKYFLIVGSHNQKHLKRYIM